MHTYVLLKDGRIMILWSEDQKNKIMEVYKVRDDFNPNIHRLYKIKNIEVDLVDSNFEYVKMKSKNTIIKNQKTFTFYWLNGEREVLCGISALKAFRTSKNKNRLISNLDFLINGVDRNYNYNKINKEWRKK